MEALGFIIALACVGAVGYYVGRKNEEKKHRPTSNSGGSYSKNPREL